TVINGNVAITPGITLTGFNPFGVINGVTTLGTSVAGQAQNDVTTTYNYFQGTVATVQMTVVDLAGQTLGSVVYKFNAAAACSTPGGILTLNGTDVYIFQIGSTLVTSGNSTIKAINGVDPSCIFWQAGSSATLSENSECIGNIYSYAPAVLQSMSSVRVPSMREQQPVYLTLISLLVTIHTLPVHLYGVIDLTNQYLIFVLFSK
ncbi:unnamed protein product, partial [Rotaria magnacalcarata]